MTAPAILSALRLRRLELRQHQQIVSERAGYCLNSVMRWENGANSPNLHALIAWAETLGLEITVERKADPSPIAGAA